MLNGDSRKLSFGIMERFGPGWLEMACDHSHARFVIRETREDIYFELDGGNRKIKCPAACRMHGRIQTDSCTSVARAMTVKLEISRFFAAPCKEPCASTCLVPWENLSYFWNSRSCDRKVAFIRSMMISGACSRRPQRSIDLPIL